MMMLISCVKNYLDKYARQCQRGAIMLFFVALLPVFLGFMGLAVDLGLAFAQKGKIQDIADAVALAGAVHLSDDASARDENIRDRVQKYIEANGLAVDRMVLKNTADAWASPETLAADENSCVAYGVVTVNTDGVDKERLRVRITKRAPAFFLNVLGDFSDGLTLNALAAAEGKNVDPSSGKPKLWISQWNMFYQGASNLVVPSENYDLPIYAGANAIDPYAFPGTGTIYANALTNWNGTWYWDEASEIPVADPPINGRILNPNNGWTTVWSSDLSQEKQKEYQEKQAEQSQLINEQAQQAYDQCKSLIDSIDKTDFVAGKDNKRYIGWIDGSPFSNITAADAGTEIDLYMEGTAEFNSYPCQYNSILTNEQLQGVTRIGNLYCKQAGDMYTLYIQTTGITYGNVYGSNIGVTYAGQRNIVTGVLYGDANFYLGGEENSLTCSTYDENGNTGLIAPGTVTVGSWDSFRYALVDDWGNVKEDGKNGLTMNEKTEKSSDADWRFYIGCTPDGGTDSGSSSDGEKKLRLVE